MTSNRPETLAAIVLVAAGIFASVAVAQQAGGPGQTGGKDFRTEWCTRYEALTMAASYGIRQGRTEQVANNRMVVVGIRKGDRVKMTLVNAFDHCQVVKFDTL